MNDTSGRLAPLRDDQWPSEAAHLLGDFAGRLNVYRVMAHNPALLLAWENFRNHVVRNSSLSPEQSEIVILRTGHRWDSTYEWMHHVVRGREAGLTDERIAAAGARAAVSRSDDALLIDMVDSLLDNGRLGDLLRERATLEIGTSAVIDVLATVGMYTTLAFLTETYAVPIDADIATAFPDDIPMLAKESHP